MALTGNHIAGESGHDEDHNLLDRALNGAVAGVNAAAQRLNTVETQVDVVRGQVQVTQVDVTTVQATVATVQGQTASLQAEVTALAAQTPGQGILGPFFHAGIRVFEYYDHGVTQVMEWARRGILGSGVSIDSDNKTIHVANSGVYLIKLRFDLQPAHGATYVEVVPTAVVNLFVGDFFQMNGPVVAGADCQVTESWIVALHDAASFQMTAVVTGQNAPEEVGDGTLTVYRLGALPA